MANSQIYRSLTTIRNGPTFLRPLFFPSSRFYSTATATVDQSHSDGPSSSFTFSDVNEQINENNKDDSICVKATRSNAKSETASSSSVTMPMSFMTGSIAGKRFYKQVTMRLADDGNGWTVMIDYRTLKTPSKRPLKLPTLALAKAIAAEWEYLQIGGIRPFMMPLMKLACTALERVSLTRPKIIESLMKKFNQDLVFCRVPDDNDLTSGVHEKQAENIDPLLEWVTS